jgi:DNA-binding CsgD family transcriptional regulator
MSDETVPTSRAGHIPPRSGTHLLRVAVAVEDAAARQSLVTALRSSSVLEVVAWADSLPPLLVLGTRIDVCLCADPPPGDDAAQLARHGCVIAVQEGDPVASVLAAAAHRGAGAIAVRRPQLSPRQREVLLAYVSSGDLLPTIARRLGMDPETTKTHLRRIRAKYAEVGRPAPTRRDLYARALEDGLIRPPSR